MRVSGPALPSGRSAASTGQMVPSPVCSEQIRIRWLASWVATLRAPSGSASVGGLVHEDHVHVGDVVELVAAALAHRDHRQPRLRSSLAHALPGDGERGVEGACRQVGELGGRVVDPEVVGQVPRSQAEQEPAVLDPQRVDGLGVGLGRGRRVVTRLCPDRAQQALPHGVRRRPGRAHRRVGELAPLLRMAAEVVGERLAGAEHREQPHGGALVVDERPEHRFGVVLGVRQVDQPVEREVGIRRPGDQRHQRFRDPIPQRPQTGLGRLGVLEPHPREAPLLGARVAHLGPLTSQGPAPRPRSPPPAAPTRGPAPPGPP